MASQCPHCGGAIEVDRKYCQNCGRRTVSFKLCPKCDEPISAIATMCPYCSQRIPTEKDIAAKALDLQVRATHLGALFAGVSLTGLFFPPIIRVSQGRITVTKWSFLGLRRHNQDIQVTRVASVRYTKGIIWADLLVETFGGASEDITEKGLRQSDARMMADNLKSCLSNEP